MAVTADNYGLGAGGPHIHAQKTMTGLNESGVNVNIIFHPVFHKMGAAVKIRVCGKSQIQFREKMLLPMGLAGDNNIFHGVISMGGWSKNALADIIGKAQRRPQCPIKMGIFITDKGGFNDMFKMFFHRKILGNTTAKKNGFPGFIFRKKGVGNISGKSPAQSIADLGH